MNLLLKYPYCTALLGIIFLASAASTASGQVLTFTGTGDYLINGYQDETFGPMTLTITFPSPLTPYPYDNTPTYADYLCTYSASGFGGFSGYGWSTSGETVMELQQNDNDDYGLISILNSGDGLSLEMLSKQPISSTDYFPSGIDTANFYVHDGTLFTHDYANGVVYLNITGYSGSVGFAPVPEASTYALVLAAAVLGFVIVRRQRLSHRSA